MQFKVGDKVKLIHFPHEYMVGQIGFVIEVRSSGHSFPYKIRMNNSFRPSVFEREIEKVITKNQQLLFEFME